jgi:hypothetical protein
VNESRLEKRLRFQLECSTIVWKKPKSSAFASVTADAGKKRIVMPLAHPLGKSYDDWYLLQTLFHELAHVAVPGELGAFGNMEEDVLERVIEPRLMAWVVKRPRIHAWWLRKLREAKDAK